MCDPFPRHPLLVLWAHASRKAVTLWNVFMYICAGSNVSTLQQLEVVDISKITVRLRLQFLYHVRAPCIITVKLLLHRRISHTRAIRSDAIAWVSYQLFVRSCVAARGSTEAIVGLCTPLLTEISYFCQRPYPKLHCVSLLCFTVLISSPISLARAISPSEGQSLRSMSPLDLYCWWQNMPREWKARGNLRHAKKTNELDGKANGRRK